MKHFKTTINFEALDEADARRIEQRMLAEVDKERRLLYSTGPEETFEMFGDPTPSERDAVTVDAGGSAIDEPQQGEPSDVEIYGAGSA